MGQTLGNMKNSMPGMGGTNVADPGQAWGNMDSSQRGVALIGGIGKGVGQGLQNMQGQQQAIQQRGNGMVQMPAAQDNPLQFPPGFVNSHEWNSYKPDPGMGGQTRKRSMNFYGGG